MQNTTPSSNKRLHQAPQNHCIGNVADVKLVEAHQPRCFCNVMRNAGQRIRLPGTPALIERSMHLLHEGMEMYAPLLRVGHGIEEAVHQKALAASDAAPDPDTARQFRIQQADGAAPCGGPP